MSVDANILAVATTLLVLIGLFIARRHFTAQALRDRFEMYQWVEQPITDDEVRLAQEFWEEYFSKEAFTTKYREDAVKTRRYIACLRKYHFLLYTKAYETTLTDPYKVDIATWVRELAKIEEFRDVHARYYYYYPALARYLGDCSPELKIETRLP